MFHAPIAGQPVFTAQWADKTHALYTNPACLERAKKDKDD